MKRITKEEKNLLLFMFSTSIGTIRINYGSSAAQTILLLEKRKLVKRHQPLVPRSIPFPGLIIDDQAEYWSLNDLGWKKCKSFTKK